MRNALLRSVHAKLLVSMLAVVCLLTTAVLALVRARVHRHVTDELQSTLNAEAAVYGQAEAARRAQAEQSAALIADLPSVKALVSTEDPLTVQDAAPDLLRTSGADLLAFQSPSGAMLALQSRSGGVSLVTVWQLLSSTAAQQDWWFADGHLFAVNLAPIGIGEGADRRELGRIVLGREVSPQTLGALAQSAPLLARDGKVLVGSLGPRFTADFERWLGGQETGAERAVNLGGERYFIRSVPLPGEHPVQLYLLRSYDEATSFLRTLNRLLLALGTMAILLGAAVVFLLSRHITGPLSSLARGMQQVTQERNFSTRVEIAGRDEIALLGMGFNCMLAELERHEAAKKRFEEKLQRQALYDEVTGLPNRRLLGDRLGQARAQADREKQLIALLYIDLDGFKLVNDSLGHPVGDLLLGQVAMRLGERVRKSDTLARIGGDEFVVLAQLNNEEEAKRLAGDLLQVLSPHFLIDDAKVAISGSIGISFYPTDAADPADLFQQADSAMYYAKRSGKNAFRCYTPELGSTVRERMNLETQLRGALDRGEISVHYQPEFELASGRLTRFEALARWTHPILGAISPGKFIPVAEETGMIIALGAWVMEAACSAAVEWQARAPYPIQVAVNVSSIQFTRENFADDVQRVLARTGLRPELLQIELTESVMLNGAARAEETLKRLREIGITLAIDDFGTGYSNLSYLPRLSLDAMKIDRSFVSYLESRPEARAMITSLVSLAHTLDLRVIVEGVETPEQLELIRGFGADEVQGYLMGRPSADSMAQVLALSQRAADTAAEATAPQHHSCDPVAVAAI
jgi:diguanylate cyclase